MYCSVQKYYRKKTNNVFNHEFNLSELPIDKTYKVKHIKSFMQDTRKERLFLIELNAHFEECYLHVLHLTFGPEAPKLLSCNPRCWIYRFLSC